MTESDFDTIIVQRSKLLMRPDGRAAILLEGQGRANKPYSVAFEVNLQNISVLRADLAKAEMFLSAQAGQA